MATSKVHFNIVDIAVALVSFITYILDVSTDILVCIQLLLDDQKIWGWLMVVFITVPAILMSAFSLIWHFHDKTVKPWILVSHLLLIAPVQRYVCVVWFGVNSYRSRKAVVTQKALRAQGDVSILRLIEAFLESAPQLMLQLYILLYQKRGGWFTGISAGCSLVSMTWAMTVYCDSQRRVHSSNYRCRLIRLLLHWGWQLFMAASRIAAFVFFACTLHNWVFGIMGGHWLIAFVWISIRGTDFGIGFCEKWLFRLVCAFIYIFVFLNLNDGKSRWRVSAYYVLFFLENAAMAVVYMVLGDNSHRIWISCSVVFGTFFLGLACMLVYYIFLHPSGSAKRFQRYLPRSLRCTDVSSSLSGIGPQIFRLDSPNPVTVMEETTVDLSLDTCGSQSSAVTTQQTWVLDESASNSQPAGNISKLSKQTLQLAWQSGMDSSSGSSSLSSLVSIANKPRRSRTPSVRSRTSHGSASSDNRLLPPVPKSNDLCRSPSKMTSKAEVQSIGNLKRELLGEGNESDNLNLNSGSSRSPTLSKSSWARSSDYIRQSMVLEDLTVLGFDDSSSIEKRISDCSSFNNQPKSLSPMNFSSLWKDVNGRLRATIAATIAAATGNLPSDESTANQSQSVTCISTISGQEESLNLTHNVSSLHHNTTFMNSSSSLKNNVENPQSNSQNLSHQREALCSLPDIIEALNQEKTSDIATPDSSFEKSGKSATPISSGELLDADEQTVTAISPARFSKGNYSPYPQDSTLTASKLEIKRPRSYLSSQKSTFVYPDSVNCEQSDSLINLPCLSPQENPRNIPSINEGKCDKDGSPFTDQELVSVMAKSLQNYVGASSSSSYMPEREGLALTLDDLRISRETTPSQSPLSRAGGEGSWKSRSASSLFHDSTDSSPMSSASKMNRVTSVIKSEANLSPNALKQIEESPKRLDNRTMGSLPLVDNEHSLPPVPHSLALKFIIESYGSTTLKSPHFATPVSRSSKNKISVTSGRSKTIDPHSSSGNEKILPGFKLSQKHCKASEELSLEDPLPIEVKSCNGKMSCPSHKCLASSSSVRRSQMSTKDHEPMDNARHSQARGGVSSTKKLNVHFSDFPVLEYDSSLFHQQCELEDSDSASGTDGYVAGQYFPPLCGNNEENLDHERRHLHDLKSVMKSGLHLSPDKRYTKQLNRISLGVDSEEMLNAIREEIIKRDSELEKLKSDFFHLHQSYSSPDKKFLTSISQPNLQNNSPRFYYEGGNAELSIHGSRNRSQQKSQPSLQTTSGDRSFNSGQTKFGDRSFNSGQTKLEDRSFNSGQIKSGDSFNSGQTKSGDRSFISAHAKIRDQSFEIRELTDDEMYVSAKQVADYFSEALESTSNNPCYRSRPKKYYSLSQLKTRSQRQPLQRLDNSLQASPEVGTIKTNVPKRERVIYCEEPSNRDYSKHSASLHTYDYRSRCIPRHSLQQESNDVKQKLMFESTSKIARSNSRKLSSKPPVHRLYQSPSNK